MRLGLSALSGCLPRCWQKCSVRVACWRDCCWPATGALILWLSDQIILWLARVWMEVSTGSVTALVGAPLLLWLLPRLRSMRDSRDGRGG